MNRLRELRDELDVINDELIQLLDKRMRIADEIAAYKDSNHLPLNDVQRELAILKHAVEKVQHPILKERIRDIFMLIMDCAKKGRLLAQKVSFPFTRIGIIGLGLIGGSIAKMLKAKNQHMKIFTIKTVLENHQEALQEGIIDQEYGTIEELMQNTDLIILASPISTIVPLAELIVSKQDCLQGKLVVMDTASVKGKIVESFQKLSTDKIEFVSTHPMAGSEKAGYENSNPFLFLEPTWIITPHDSNLRSTLQCIEDFIKTLGGQSKYLSGETHDFKAALVSHLPGIISKAIKDFVEECDPDSLSLAGPGFKSMTRLAHSNIQLRSEIIQFNKQQIRHNLEKWIDYIHLKEKELE